MKPTPPKDTRKNCSSPRKAHARKYVFSSTEPQNFEEIAISLSNGFDIRDVDPLLHGALLPYIYDLQNEMQRTYNKSAYESLEKARFYIKQRQSEMYSRTQERLRLASLIPSKDEIDECVNEIIEEGDVKPIDKRLFPYVLQELKNLRLDYLSQEKFNQVIEIEQYIKDLTRVNEVKHIADYQTQKMERYDNGISEAHSKYKTTKSKYKMLLKQLIDERNAEVSKLEDELDLMLQEFDTNTNMKIQSTRKPSPQYLALKDKMQHLSSSRRYVEAAQMRDELKKMERIEKKKHEKQFKEGANIQRKTIIKKQEDKIDAVIQKYQMKIISLKKERNRELASLNKLAINLQNKFDEAQEIKDTILYTPRRMPSPRTPTKRTFIRGKPISNTPQPAKISKSSSITPISTPQQPKRSNSVRKPKDSPSYSPRKPKFSQTMPNFKRNESTDDLFTVEMFKQKRKANQIMYTHSKLLGNAIRPGKKETIYD